MALHLTAICVPIPAGPQVSRGPSLASPGSPLCRIPSDLWPLGLLPVLGMGFSYRTLNLTWPQRQTMVGCSRTEDSPQGWLSTPAPTLPRPFRHLHSGATQSELGRSGSAFFLGHGSFAGQLSPRLQEIQLPSLLLGVSTSDKSLPLNSMTF